MSKIQGILFLASLALVSQNVQAENQCSENSAAEAVKQLGDIVDSMYNPPDKVNSCAVQLHKIKKANWKDSVDLEAPLFLNQEKEFLAQIQKESGDDFKIYMTDRESLVARNALWSATKAVKGNDKPAAALFETLEKASIKEQSKFSKALYGKINSPETLKKLIEKSKSKTCSAGVNYSLEPEDGFHNTLYSEFKDEAAAKSALQNEMKKYQSEIKTPEGEVLSAIRVCSDPVPIEAPLIDATSKETFELPSEVTFASNSTALTIKAKTAINTAIEKALKSTTPGCTKQVIAFSVRGSANALKGSINTAIGDLNGFNFEAVSKYRGEAVYKAMKLALKSLETAGKVELKLGFDKRPPEFEGNNGDGTSGPCPYVLEPSKSGVFNVVLDHLTPEDRWELRKAKAGNATLEIVEKCTAHGKDEVPDPMQKAFASKCYNITPRCI